MNVYLFFLFFLILAFFNSLLKKNANIYSGSYGGYFLAGRSIHFWPQVLALAGTQIGAGLILGVASEFGQFGCWICFYPLGVFLGFILLSKTLHFRFSVYNVFTNAEIFFKIYGCPYLKKTVSLINLLSLFIIFIAQCSGSKIVFQYLGIDSPSLFVGFWTIVILYSMQGGLKTIISTDKIQVFSIICVFLTFFFASFFFSSAQIGSLKWEGEFSFVLIRYLVAPILYLWIEQDMEQRCLAGSFKNVSNALIAAGFVVFAISGVTIFFVSSFNTFEVCRLYGGSLLQGIELMFSKNGALVFVCAVLFAITSTAVSAVNAMGCILAVDFSIPSLKRKQMIPLIQGFSCTIALLGIMFAGSFDSILDLLIFGYGLSICSLLVPLVMGLKKKKMGATPAWFSLIFGLVGYILGSWFFPSSPIEVICLGISCFGFFTGDIISRKKNAMLHMNIS